MIWFPQHRRHVNPNALTGTEEPLNSERPREPAVRGAAADRHVAARAIDHVSRRPGLTHEQLFDSVSGTSPLPLPALRAGRGTRIRLVGSLSTDSVAFGSTRAAGDVRR